MKDAAIIVTPISQPNFKSASSLAVKAGSLIDTPGTLTPLWVPTNPVLLTTQWTLFPSTDFTIYAGEEVIGDTTKCSVTYAGLANDVKAGDTILIDDGLVGLTVKSVEGNKVHCVVNNNFFTCIYSKVCT